METRARVETTTQVSGVVASAPPCVCIHENTACAAVLFAGDQGGGKAKLGRYPWTKKEEKVRICRCMHLGCRVIVMPSQGSH